VASAPSAEVLRGIVAAQNLRLERGIGLEPIIELWDFIRALDVDLAFHDFGSEGADGVYLWNGTRALIVVNTGSGDVAKQRFTAAHELGHHILHGGHSGQPLEIVDANVYSTENDAEREANAFASRLLAPEAAMRAAFPGKDRADITAEDVADLMHRYGTSFQTTVYQLHNSGRIYAEDRDRLFNEASGRVKWIMRAKGYDREALAPGEDLPSWYVVEVLDMCRAGSIGVERAAELLRRDPAAVQELLSDEAPAQAPDAAVRALLGEEFDDLLRQEPDTEGSR
jgi:Zn-dependent peptidase ImmA (M78 family)